MEALTALTFSENQTITMDTFPSVQELRDILLRDDMNRALNIVKNRIITARQTYQPFARMLPADMPNAEILNHVKNFLREKGYIIIELETAEGVSNGWKIVFG
jgi:hypothetical protein